MDEVQSSLQHIIYLIIWMRGNCRLMFGGERTFSPQLTDRIKSLTRKEWGCCTEVSVMELNVVRPLLPSAYAPRPPPAAVVQYRSFVVVLPDLHTYDAAFRANWELYQHTHTKGRLIYVINILLSDIYASSESSRVSILALLDQTRICCLIGNFWQCSLYVSICNYD